MKAIVMNDATPSRIKRRNARRIQLKFPIWLRSAHQSDDLTEGIAQDISVSGLVLVADERVDVSTSVTVCFDSLPGDRKTRQIDAVVTRAERVNDTGQYLIGVKFTDPDEASRDYITVALQQTDIMGLLRLMEKKGASDLHLATNHPPVARIIGQLQPLRKHPLSGPDLKAIIYSLLDDDRKRVFEQELDWTFRWLWRRRCTFGSMCICSVAMWRRPFGASNPWYARLPSYICPKRCSTLPTSPMVS